MKVLLLQLEFPAWKTARPWTYGASFAVAEGLAANGVSCLTVPIGPDVPPSSPASWLSHARQFLTGQRFDQVWIWLVHSSLDPQVLEWVAGLAPVRVGFVMESLRYEEEDYAWAPHLRPRAQLFAQHFEYLTHALVCDERDASDLTAQGQKPVLWWPGFVPNRFIVQQGCPPINNRAVFHGVPYGHRAHWLDHPLLRQTITFAKSSSQLTPNQQQFDVLQSAVHARLLQQPPVMEEELRQYVDALRTVREAEFRDWLNGLSDWAAIVNLPGLTRCFGGRVFEAMAIGRPVISWEIPGRPKTNALFQNNHEIIFFSADSPYSLAQRIEYVLSDPKRAHSIGSNGQRKILAHHTAERRMQQILEWIESGKEPDYGIHPVSAEQPTGACVVVDAVGDKDLMREESMDSDNFYVNLFVKSPHWSTPDPNADEAARWSKIAAFLEYILRRVRQQDRNRQLRMLDVGCGRGWLTNLAAAYGTCEGIEPVAEVVEWARTLFPRLRFEAGTAESVLRRPDFEPYDVVLTSEVIEHVPHGQKEVFLAQLAKLLKPDGYLILTTPRGEMWEQWKTIAPPNQPVEDWVTEEQLRALFTSQGFVEMGLDRIHVEVPGLRYVPAPTPADLRSMNLLPIYQVWCCRRSVDQRPIPFTRAPKVSVIIPTYNRPDRLRTALASLATQTYQDFEIIVVNDAGSDVGSIVAACVDRHRIMTITHDRNRGLAAARNSGLRAAKGTYIAYLDDDDRYLPHHLETLVAYLDRDECRVAYTDAWRVQERQTDAGYVETGRDVPYSYDFKPADLLVSNYFPVLCVMHDRACLDEVGLFDESLFAHEDWDLWIRMATRFHFKHLPVRTAEFTWRTDGSSMTSGTRETYWRTTEIIYRKYRPYADLICGVREAQDKRLTEMRAVGSAKHYVCSIVMPVWNRVELTKDCLTALAGLKDQPEYELIVVDNGSTDGTTDFLRQLSGDVRVILNEENLGFAKACNQGAAAARGKYLVFLNNDTIPQPGWLTALVAEVDNHAEVGVVGSKLLYPDGTVQHAGVVRDCSRRLPYHIYKSFAASHPAVNQRREFQIVTAACLLIRRALFDEVGGFDEGYMNGFEDADLCLKVRERGYVIVYQPRSVVVHLESQTPGRKLHDDVNATRFLDRWRAQWWAGDEDLHFHVDGYKLKRVFRNGRDGGDILMFNDIKDRAAWAHVAATQAAALKQDWPAVKRELSLVSDWPDDPEILAWASSVCEHLQEPRLRQTFLSRYLALEEAPKERLSLIRSLLEQKDLRGADSHLQSLLASSPNHAEGLMLKGILCMQREQYEQAELAFASARQEGADLKKCLMGMGMAAMGRAYTQGAWERFLEVLAENPDDAEAIHWLLRAGTEQNRWQELGEQLSAYVVRNPDDLAVRFALASVLLRAQQLDDAQREYGRLRMLAPSYDGLIELGQALANKEAVLAYEASNS